MFFRAALFTATLPNTPFEPTAGMLRCLGFEASGARRGSTA
jgi:hypothetical protein